MRPCASSSVDADAASSGVRVCGTGVGYAPRPEHHAGPEVLGEVDHLLRERQPGVVGLVAEQEEHVVPEAVLGPGELGLLPGELGVDAVDEAHRGPAGPPVEQRVGVEAGHGAAARARSREHLGGTVGTRGRRRSSP